MPPDDNLPDLLQVELPDIPSIGEDNTNSRKTDRLDRLRVASPCSASWEEMEGDDLVRFCRDCRLNVYNLSGMHRREAAALVRDMEGRLCVRFYRRRDGTLLTTDCPVGWRAARRRLLGWMGTGMAVVFGVAGLKPPPIELYIERRPGQEMGLFDASGPINPPYASPSQFGLFTGALVAAILAIIRRKKSEPSAACSRPSYDVAP